VETENVDDGECPLTESTAPFETTTEEESKEKNEEGLLLSLQ